MNQPPPHFDIVETSPGHFRASGEFDAHATETFERVLAERAGTDVAIDLSDVSFIDSSGLRSIVLHHQRAGESSGRLRIVSPSPQVARLFELSQLGDYLEITA